MKRLTPDELDERIKEAQDHLESFHDEHATWCEAGEFSCDCGLDDALSEVLRLKNCKDKGMSVVRRT